MEVAVVKNVSESIQRLPTLQVKTWINTGAPLACNHNLAV